MLESNIDSLIDDMTQGKFRALAKIISIIEDESPDKIRLLKKIYKFTGNAHVLGITGSPGAGKSSLTDRVTAHIRRKNETVGIIAVDPTSPYTGGALLGDRIRMQDHYQDPGVYIRSMGTRGSLGGLARNTKDSVKALDAFGFDWIIVETVGVGQAELDIVDVSDTTLVVLTPGTGDSIQTIKAGIMEIADIFVINKCDLPGAYKLESDINQMLNRQKEILDWQTPVVQVSSLNNEGIQCLMETILKHKNYIKENKLLESIRKDRIRKETLEIVNDRWQKLMSLQTNNKAINDILEKAVKGKIDPFTAAEEILDYILNKPDKEIIGS